MDCKLCFKSFSNGKALGAHMRSHYAILPLPPKHHPDDTESSSGGGGKSKSKSKNSSRFKRQRRINLEMEEERDVALCLIMLSRDVWRRNSDCSSRKIHRCEECQKVFKSSQGLGSHKASHSKRMRNSFQGREKGEVVGECSMCPRIFKSAALGGHKRSHLPAPKFVGNLVDLNLPAVNEEILG
ncbi:hypothetical protein SASPL_108867 [Salvia splendens]|uniref:C2H2-type domain-containing protein n=2 Tax=Salvia splendens TaxID=180675 RepID=A0A8X8YG29_SALSN|nr:hypothetical protein SASPL_108867 [Salvia splendens]